VPHRVRAQPQPFSDVRVREPLRRQQRDLRLAPAKAEGDPQLLRRRQRGSGAVHGLQPRERRETGGEGASQRHHRQEPISGGTHRGHSDLLRAPAGVIERSAQPSRLVSRQLQEPLEPRQGILMSRPGGQPEGVLDPPQTLGEPCVLAVPFERGHQGLDGLDQRRQVHAEAPNDQDHYAVRTA